MNEVDEKDLMNAIEDLTRASSRHDVEGAQRAAIQLVRSVDRIEEAAFKRGAEQQRLVTLKNMASVFPA